MNDHIETLKLFFRFLRDAQIYMHLTNLLMVAFFGLALYEFTLTPFSLDVFRLAFELFPMTAIGGIALLVFTQSPTSLIRIQGVITAPFMFVLGG